MHDVLCVEDKFVGPSSNRPAEYNTGFVIYWNLFSISSSAHPSF